MSFLATKKNMETKAAKLTQKRTKELEKEFKSYTPVGQKNLLKAFGVGTDWLTCQYCGKVLRYGEFHVSNDAFNKTKRARICKSCVEKVVYRIENEDDERKMPTKESILAACEYLDKPFLEDLYASSVNEVANSTSNSSKSNAWGAYVKNINSLDQYALMRFSNSDIFKGVNTSLDEPKDELPKDQEMLKMYEQNKMDAIRLLGYDPFEKESLADQPLLYASLIGYLDASPDANEDRMRVSSIIEIVKGFSHIEKLNDVITSLMKDVKDIDKNIATVKALEDTKNKITTSVLKLAKDNGISLKHSVNGSKGENTLTGMSKRLKDVNLREYEVNAFDIGTCKGMKQVADISHASIIEQIKLDENDYTGMLAEQRTMIVKLQEENEEWQEKARILLRENIDLKNYLEEQGMLSEDLLDSETILNTSDESGG